MKRLPHRRLAVAALGAGLLATAAGAAPTPVQAQALAPTPAEIATFKALETDLWAAWSKRLKSADAAPFYSKQPGTLHFDISPLKFTGWEEYERESQKALPKDGSAKVTIKDDFTVIKGNDALFVVAFTWDAVFLTPEGAERRRFEGRETDVWVKEAGKWVVLHQHLSVAPKH